MVSTETWNTGVCMRTELCGCDYATRPVISGMTNQKLTASSNSYVDLVCIVQEPLIRYIKWYTSNTDITSHSTGLVRGANGVKQSTLRLNYTSDADVLNTYDCNRFESSLWCFKTFICRALYGNNKTEADGIKSAVVKVRYDYPSRQSRPTVKFLSSTVVGIVWQKLQLNEFQKPVISYAIVYQNGKQSVTLSALSLSLVITGLKIYTSYNITIKAVSIVGDGKWSQPMNFRTDSTIPTGFPTSIRAEALTSQSIRVTWQAPTSGINGPFLGYRVFCRSGSDRRESTATPQQASHTFSGLRKWTVYNFTVFIHNDKGDGPINGYVAKRTFEDAPGQPQSFQVTVLNSTGVQLDWALPIETNGIIKGFKLRYEKNGNTSEMDLPGNTTLTYVLTGLDKCTLYSFRMLAYTIKDGILTASKQKATAEDGK
ncbi:protein sidekick-1-like [Actinia tenebrosa]|uniref:Protein sidekick-1-like n=1 Tax=Actinia tenebrosa TaxID=6105 RepID=A0A6P8HB61_ACTTE|nr:protein sidekick-1-like [Actinia tenebrosa]